MLFSLVSILNTIFFSINDNKHTVNSSYSDYSDIVNKNHANTTSSLEYLGLLNIKHIMSSSDKEIETLKYEVQTQQKNNIKIVNCHIQDTLNLTIHLSLQCHLSD